MADAPPNSDELILQFVELAGVSAQVAEQYLASSRWDFSSAVTEYYNPAEEPDTNQQQQNPELPEASPAAPQPIPTSTNMPPPPAQAPKKKFATLGDLRGGGAGPSHTGHGHDDDDDDENNEPSDDDNQNLYAGGEKSGLAVENPDDLKKKIVERAKKNVARPGGDDPREATSNFTGTARTLGGDDTPSEVIPDPSANRPQRAPRVERHLHFWADGFSVDDGPLFRADDPANAAILAQIKQGRAPMSMLNVEPGQEVDVKLEQHTEKYVQPKKKYQPFSGGGQRLGSPTPGVGTSAENPPAPPPSSASTPAPNASAAPSIDEAQPTLSLQIRLGDGTRLPARFNTTHTIGDVYSFVTASNAESRTRSWALMTTFPSKELTDKSQILGDLAEFKRGGVVVQKWQ